MKKTVIKIQKALVEAKFMAKPEDMDKLMPKLEDDDIVKLVDENEEITEGINNDPKIEKFVSDLNTLISKAIDGDGNPIGVTDKSSTWEKGYIYAPIVYQNGFLKISSKNALASKWDTELIRKNNMEFEGIPTLKYIKRLYVAAMNKSAKPQQQPLGFGESEIKEDEHERAGRSIEYGSPEGELNDADWEELHKSMNEEESFSQVNPDKLRVDVAKFMDKLNLGQFEAILSKIDKPQEQAEIIAAFAERIGVPRAKLPMVLASIKNVAENTNARISKAKLVEFVIKSK